MAEVTQADREAARKVLERGDGVYDLAEDFARHRTEAMKPLVEALEDIKLAAEEAAYACASCKTTCGPVKAVNEIHVTTSAALRSVQS